MLIKNRTTAVATICEGNPLGVSAIASGIICRYEKIRNVVRKTHNVG